MRNVVSAQPGALSRELTRRGLSQADLERLTGVSRAVLARLNRGESVSERTLGRIGVVLEQTPVRSSIDALLGIQPESAA